MPISGRNSTYAGCPVFPSQPCLTIGLQDALSAMTFCRGIRLTIEAVEADPRIDRPLPAEDEYEGDTLKHELPGIADDTADASSVPASSVDTNRNGTAKELGSQRGPYKNGRSFTRIGSLRSSRLDSHLPLTSRVSTRSRRSAPGGAVLASCTFAGRARCHLIPAMTSEARLKKKKPRPKARLPISRIGTPQPPFTQTTVRVPRFTSTGPASV